MVMDYDYDYFRGHFYDYDYSSDRNESSTSKYKLISSDRIINGKSVDISQHPWTVFISLG